MPENYTGLSDYKENIRLVSTTDPVLGGIDGETNFSAKDLADRTVYLKKNLIGEIIAFGSPTAPNGYINCNGAELDRIGVYADLFAITGLRFGKSIQFLDALAIASLPIDAHGFITGDSANIESFSGSNSIEFPGAVTITPATDCFIRAIDANSISLHPTALDATNNTNAATIDPETKDSHITISKTDKFNVPDLGGKFMQGLSSASFDAVGRESFLRIEFGVSTPSFFITTVNYCIKYQ